jgi:hypothetical protein
MHPAESPLPALAVNSLIYWLKNSPAALRSAGLFIHLKFFKAPQRKPYAPIFCFQHAATHDIGTAARMSRIGFQGFFKIIPLLIPVFLYAVCSCNIRSAGNAAALWREPRTALRFYFFESLFSASRIFPEVYPIGQTVHQLLGLKTTPVRKASAVAASIKYSTVLPAS